MSSPRFGPDTRQLRQEHVLSDQTADRLSGTRYRRIPTGDSGAANRQGTFRTTTGHLPSSARLSSRLTFAIAHFAAEWRECP
jgi:hypothetical protein